MSKPDQQRERRINEEIIVDAHGPEEQAMGWYYYLEEKLTPFTARCSGERAISPLRKGDEVEVLGLGPEDECQREMFVMIRWEKKGLAVPLAQLKPARDSERATREAVEDWLYWVKKGYQF